MEGSRYIGVPKEPLTLTLSHIVEREKKKFDTTIA